MSGFRSLPEDGVPPPIRIFDPPTCLWHWLNAVLVIVLIISGYFIGIPLPSTSGDPSSNYLMGWIRFAHLAAGQLFALGFLFRFYWAFRGNAYSMSLFLPEVWRRSWTDGLIVQTKWMLGLVNSVPRYVGINPLSNVAMLLLFVLPSAVANLTGFAMLAEVAGHESWQYAYFGWMVSLCGNTMDLHLYHRLCMWVLLWFGVVHVYLAVREDIMSRQTVVSTILSGIRSYRR